ncbi:uncharacterized protein [Choristoneura fumiferana]|uniref:uncharacterized protein n=1 Tax=Choristoneura fumiferana TaxID=7141 RepID=UPI003D15CF2A
MMLLVLCLVGSALAMPTTFPAVPRLEDEMYISAPVIRAYAAPTELAPLKNLEVRIEPIPNEEGEIPEPISDLSEPEEPRESTTSEAPKEGETVIIKLSPPRFFTLPPFISEWFSFLPSSITDLFKPSKPKLLYPGYGYTVLVDEPKSEK